jgi:hypothetical protein
MNAPLTEKPEDAVVGEIQALREDIAKLKHKTRALYAGDVESMLFCESCDTAALALLTAMNARRRYLGGQPNDGH